MNRPYKCAAKMKLKRRRWTFYETINLDREEEWLWVEKL
jgi:hypothetical protein